jgi:hypothetical protein
VDATRQRSFVSIAVDTIRPYTDHDPRVVACSECGSTVELQQPDPQDPHRLLGSCHDCRTWYVIDLAPERREAVIARIPRATVSRRGARSPSPRT